MMAGFECRMLGRPGVGRCLLILAVALMASALGLGSAGVAYAQSDAEHQQFLFAYKLLQRGDSAEAATAFDEYLGKFPRGEKLGDAQYYRALLYRKAGDNLRAVKVLDDAAEPTLVPGYALKLLAGQSYSDLGMYKEALGPLEAIDTDELAPNLAVSALYLKGLAYRGADNLEAAATALGDAAALDTPMKARALLDLAKVRALLKDTDRAIKALSACLKLNDAKITPEAARFAGDLSYNAEQYDQAIDYYNTVVTRYQSSTHFAPSAVGLMWAQFADGRFDQVERTYQATRDALPGKDRSTAAYLAGSSRQERGDHDGAAELLSIASTGQASPAIREKAYYKLAVSSYELERFAVMSEAIDALLARFPQTQLKLDAAFLRASAEAEAGQVERGVARLTEFVRQGPSSAYYGQALLRRAHLYETHGELAAAARDYEAYLVHAPKPTPTSLQARFRLMELLGALSQHRRTIELATAVLAIDDAALRTPEVEQEALYRKAVAHRYLNELPEALALHEQLIREHPINPYRDASLFEQGLIRMTQGDSERGVPLLLSAADRESLGASSRISALRVVAQHQEDAGHDEKAFDLRIKMQEVAERDQVLTSAESLWMAERLIDRGEGAAALRFVSDADAQASRDRALLVTARALELLDRDDEALDKFNEVRAVSERYNLDAWLEIALLYRKQGKLDQALRELAALQNPDRGQRIASRALYEGGLIHKGLAMKRLRSEADASEHVKAAREAFKKLWLLYPDREGEVLAKRAALHLASLQGATGQAEAQIRTLTELAEAEPNTAESEIALAALADLADQPERRAMYVRRVTQRGEGDVELSRLMDELIGSE